MAKQPQVYVVSDSLGETAESVAKATIGQYDTDIEIHRVPFIRHTDQIEKIIDEAAQAGAVVCHTLVSPELRADFERIAHEKNVRYVDILGPMMNMVTDVAGVQPRMKPGIIHRLDDEFGIVGLAQTQRSLAHIIGSGRIVCDQDAVGVQLATPAENHLTMQQTMGNAQ